MAVFVVSAVVSVIASTVSLIASATGHERTAQRAAKVAVTAAWIATATAAVTTFVMPESGMGMLRAASLVLAYVSTAQAVANRDRIQQTAADLGVSEKAADTAASAQFKLVAQEQHSLDSYINESIVPGPRGQPLSEWRNGRPTEWGNPLKYTEQADGAWKWAERVALGTAAALTVAPLAQESIPLLSRVGSILFGKKGLLNNNDYIRIGVGWNTEDGPPHPVIRVGIGSRRLPFWAHIDLWPKLHFSIRQKGIDY